MQLLGAMSDDKPLTPEYRLTLTPEYRLTLTLTLTLTRLRAFRHALAEKVRWYLGLEIDPERQITVTCGATEAMAAVMLATVDPGDEVIVFEPYYENYGPNAILVSATPRYVSLHPPDWTFDEAELRQAFNPHSAPYSLKNLQAIAL